MVAGAAAATAGRLSIVAVLSGDEVASMVLGAESITASAADWVLGIVVEAFEAMIAGANANGVSPERGVDASRRDVVSAPGRSALFAGLAGSAVWFFVASVVGFDVSGMIAAAEGPVGLALALTLRGSALLDCETGVALAACAASTGNALTTAAVSGVAAGAVGPGVAG